MSAMSRRVVVGLSACVLFACQADLDEAPAAGPPTADEPGLVDDAQPLVLLEFVAEYDAESGEFVVEPLPVEQWLSTSSSEAGTLRIAQQPLYCEIRATDGAPDTVSLATQPGSIGTTATECSVPNAFPYTIYGAFCATVDVTWHGSAGSVYDVTSQIVSVSPPDYAGYEFPLGTGADASVLPEGYARPSDAGGGLWLHGTLGPGATGSTQWTFRNPGGSFEFRGRIMARAVELDNGLDDNCDGRVDDRLNEYADDTPCWVNEDCISGLCHDIDPAAVIWPTGDCAETCTEGRYGDPCVDCPGGADVAQCDGHGVCDDGAPGTGVCTCYDDATNGHWTIPGGGDSCTTCISGYAGASCMLECPRIAGTGDCSAAGHGSCSEGPTGDASCICTDGYTGPLCSVPPGGLVPGFNARQRIASHGQGACALRGADDVPVCWGSPASAFQPESAQSMYDLAAAHFNGLGIRNSDRGVERWGSIDWFSGTVDPTGTFRDVDCDVFECVLLTSDGTQIINYDDGALLRTGTDFVQAETNGWGLTAAGAVVPSSYLPAGTYADIAEDWSSNRCGLTRDGEIRCSGTVDPFLNDTTYKQIDGGRTGYCAVRADNTVECVQSGGCCGPGTPPAGVGFHEVAVGLGFGCGIRLDGMIECWGSPMGTPPAGADFTPPSARVPGFNARQRIASHGQGACALRRADDVPVCWGSPASAFQPESTQSMYDIAAAHFNGVGIRNSDRGVERWGSTGSPA